MAKLAHLSDLVDECERYVTNPPVTICGKDRCGHASFKQRGHAGGVVKIEGTEQEPNCEHSKIVINIPGIFRRCSDGWEVMKLRGQLFVDVGKGVEKEEKFKRRKRKGERGEKKVEQSKNPKFERSLIFRNFYILGGGGCGWKNML
eukprot:1355026-Amorphochlora_amoeboformis.AAC.1